MDYPVSAPGFGEGRLFLRDENFKTSILFQDGKPAPAATAKRTFTLTRDDGTTVECTLKAGLDPLPKLLLDGQTIAVAPPLPAWQMVIAALPLVLVFTGGALGGALGGMAFCVNIAVFRLQLSLPVRIFLALGILGASSVTFLILAVGLSLLFAAAQG